MSRKRIGTLLAVLASQLLCTAATADESLFYACKSCHGDRGEGIEAVGAPAIAGMDANYTQRQIHNFRSGTRGGSLNDLPGRQMNLIAQILNEDADIRQLAEYVESMPVARPLPTLPEPASDISARYAPCAVCHGENAEGRIEINGPALVYLDDWYVAAQLRKFRDGVRGSAAGDVTGAQMRAAAAGLSESQIDQLAAYIVRLASQ